MHFDSVVVGTIAKVTPIEEPIYSGASIIAKDECDDSILFPALTIEVSEVEVILGDDLPPSTSQTTFTIGGAQTSRWSPAPRLVETQDLTWVGSETSALPIGTRITVRLFKELSMPFYSSGLSELFAIVPRGELQRQDTQWENGYPCIQPQSVELAFHRYLDETPSRDFLERVANCVQTPQIQPTITLLRDDLSRLTTEYPASTTAPHCGRL